MFFFLLTNRVKSFRLIEKKEVFVSSSQTTRSMYIDNKMDSLTSLKSIKRHYKKDTRYVNDLYTLTYDNHESVEDTVELISSLYFRTDIGDVRLTRVATGQIDFTLASRLFVLFFVCMSEIGFDSCRTQRAGWRG